MGRCRQAIGPEWAGILEHWADLLDRSCFRTIQEVRNETLGGSDLIYPIRFEIRVEKH